MAVHVQMVLFDGFDPLDVVGPYEILVAGGDAVGGGISLELVTAEGARHVLSGTGGLALTATSALEPERPGYVIVPGASGPVDGDPDTGAETIPVLLARAASSDLAPLLGTALAAPRVSMAAICGGSLVLAMAGLLENRAAATHVLGRDLLDATGVHAIEARIVDDGDLLTAGGVTSGLDLGLYLLDREFGPEVSLAVEKLFEYERRGTPWVASRAGRHEVFA